MARQEKARRPRRLLRVLAWCLLSAAFLLACGFWLAVRALDISYRGYESPSVRVEIPRHSSTRAILLALERGGVLRSRYLGALALRLRFPGRSVKAGEYRFSGEKSPEEILRALVEGDVISYRVTLREGLTAEEVFDLIAAKGAGLATQDELSPLFLSPQRFPEVPPGAPSLEGFLFPDTYRLTRSMTPAEIVRTLTRRYARALGPGYESRARAAGLSTLQAVTLASLIEKETAVAAERTLVSAVYHNRLAKKMLLQCDPTTIYALKRLGRWRGALLKQDLTVDEPYNTYVRPGLPPGPICNPGAPALDAAVAPAHVDYLYFVAKGDGSHRFSRDYEGQQQNVALYRAAQRAAPRNARPRTPGGPLR